MELTRNDILITNACTVSIKSVYHNSILSDFTDIYGTPSNISFSSSSRSTTSGVYFENKLELMYPGLKEEDFLNFNELIYDHYYLRLTVDAGYTLDIANEDSEMSMTTSYTIKQGHKITLIGKSSTPVQKVSTLGYSFAYDLTIQF